MRKCQSWTLHEKINLSVNITNARIDEEITCVARLGELLGRLGTVVGKYSGNLIFMIGYHDQW